MATPAQIHANQPNAQKSTGPRTDAGKAVSSANALTHGFCAQKVFPADRQEEYEVLTHDFMQKYQPADPNEMRLVETMIHATWNLARYHQLQEDLWGAMLKNDPTKTLAQIFLEDCNGPRAIDKLHRYMRDLERSYYRAAAELEKGRKEARAAAEAAAKQAKRSTNVPPPPPPEIGFVSSSGPTPVRPAENLALRL